METLFWILHMQIEELDDGGGGGFLRGLGQDIPRVLMIVGMA